MILHFWGEIIGNLKLWISVSQEYPKVTKIAQFRKSFEARSATFRTYAITSIKVACVRVGLHLFTEELQTKQFSILISYLDAAAWAGSISLLIEMSIFDFQSGILYSGTVI